MDEFLRLSCCLGLAAAWLGGLEDRDRRLSSSAKALAFLGFLVFARACLLWETGPASGAFPDPLSRADVIRLSGLCLLWGALSFWGLRRSARAALAGLMLGACAAILGFCAERWLGYGEALTRLGHAAAGGAMPLLLPFSLAVSVGFLGFALFHPAFVLGGARRWFFVLPVILAWCSATGLIDWRLRRDAGYGPRDLAQAAGLSWEPRARTVVIEIGKGPLSARAVEALFPEDLEKLERYLKRSGYRGVFVQEALDNLRRGRLSWWDSDAALAVESAGAPDFAPDYRQALALLRSGPLTEPRYQRLRNLSQIARGNEKGFEGITQSQYIYEAFSASFARFGDGDNARVWLEKIDGLWPVYEKKIEVSPVETPVQGEIAGSIEGDFSNVKVGLFFTSAATDTYHDGANLCCSQYPDRSGRFVFSNLGAGTYRLALQGALSLKDARVEAENHPLEISDKRRFLYLAPIRIIYNYGR